MKESFLMKLVTFAAQKESFLVIDLPTRILLQLVKFERPNNINPLSLWHMLGNFLELMSSVMRFVSNLNILRLT